MDVPLVLSLQVILNFAKFGSDQKSTAAMGISPSMLKM